MTALLLGALGLTLSLVVPGALLRARWPDRAPAAAIVAWQAITLAGVLCALGVVLTVPEELVRAFGAGRPAAAAALIGALLVAAVIVIRLLAALVGVSRRSRARRDRHRTLADLLDRADLPDRAERHRRVDVAGLRVLDGTLPLAYCVPGRSPRVVVSQGTLDVLDDAELDAVLRHEQAHLRHWHEVVLESFTAFHEAVPRPLRSRGPLDRVRLLLEMVADDAARRRCGPAPLRAALERLGDAVDGAEPDRRRRIDRLSRTGESSLGLSLLVLGSALGLLVLPTVIVVLPWLDRALTGWPL